MCDKQHYDDLVEKVNNLEKRMETSVDRFVIQLAAIEKGNKDIIDAWNTASGLVKFIKWLAGLMAAIWSIWYMVTHGIHK